MATGYEGKNANGDTPVVFVSYASQDAAVAGSIVKVLEKAGFSCWIAPRNVVPGDVYADAIVRAIDAARILVLALSQHAAASPHVLREVERASSKRHHIVAFRIDLAPLPAALEYFLNTSHWLDASSGSVDGPLQTLVEAVRHAETLAHATATDNAHGAVGPMPPQRQPGMQAGWASRSTRTALVSLAVIVALAAGYAAVDQVWLSKRASVAYPNTRVAAGAEDKSIAVLPFVDASERRDQGYFADGMAEEMVNVLARIPQLRVIGRVSSFQFKGQSEDVSAIGAKLGATYILQGSVRRGDARIRVGAQLVDASSGTQLWAESYDREMGDVLALQAQIASNIARALQLAVMMNDAQQLRRLKNPEAYALYLRGRSAYDRGEYGSLHEAQADFEQVLALEPTFARAAEGLALTRLSLISSAMEVSRDEWQPAVAAAQLALRLDPKSALAHAILGLKLATYDYDWAGAEGELKRALAVESRDPVVLYNCSWLAFDLGRTEEALHLQDLALSLDPLNPDSLQNGAIIYYLLGQFDRAERAFRKSLEVSPSFDGNHRYLGQILLLQGRPKEALKEMEAEGPLDRDMGLALVYHALGRRAESDAALARVVDQKRGLNPSGVAMVYAYRGEPDRAFDWLNQAVAARDLSLGHRIEHEPLLAGLRSDPRYLGVLRAMHLRN